MRTQSGSVGSNPFAPGAGDRPPYLAGREREQSLIAQYLDCLHGGDPAPFGLVVFGPRGNGKTVLLEWTRRVALERGINALSIPSALIDTEESLLKNLSTDSWWGGLVKAVSWRGLHLRLDERRSGTLQRTLFNSAKKQPLVLLIDEAHTLDTGVGAKLLQAAQNLHATGSALLLIFAATPDLQHNLQRIQATFWERSTVLPLMRLDPAASADAIRIPFESANRRITSQALAQVVDASHGYPFFLQLWGRVLWDGGENPDRTIGIEDVSRARPRFEESRDMFYGIRYQELERRGLLAPAAALASAYEETDGLASAQIDVVLKRTLEAEGRLSSRDSVAEVRTSLHDLGYIWSPGGIKANFYFRGIPSLMSFVAQLAAK